MVEVWNKKDSDFYQALKEESNMCSQFDTQDWDNLAPKKLILICFGKVENLRTPGYLPYRNNSNLTFEAGTRGRQMQNFIKDLLTTLSGIEENNARLIDQADNLFENQLRDEWLSDEIDVINVVWIRHLDATEYSHKAAGQVDVVDCNPYGHDREDTEENNECTISLYDRVIHIENRRRWAITVVMNLDSPLPWEV